MADSVIIPARMSTKWREAMRNVPLFDPCCLPEYCEASCFEQPNSEALLWYYKAGDRHLIYPFIKSEIKKDLLEVAGIDGPAYDIQTPYGYGGPQATSSDPSFLTAAWEEFDELAEEENIIAEFCRLSIARPNQQFLHPKMSVQFNRNAAITNFSANTDELFIQMQNRKAARKAAKNGFVACSVKPEIYVDEFQKIYQKTMVRKSAKDFFFFSPSYFTKLLQLNSDEQGMVAVFDGGRLVAGALVLFGSGIAIYHLAASDHNYLKFGVNNVVLAGVNDLARARGMDILVLGGGSTTSPDDGLLGFKKQHASEIVPFCIGTRVLNHQKYECLKNTFGKRDATASPWFLFWHGLVW